MIVIEQICGTLSAAAPGKQVVAVPYDWFECERRRIKKTAEDGTELGIAIPTGVQEGDILYETAEKRYVVTLRPTRLISVAIRDTVEAARVGFELGNRHLSLKLLPDRILVPYEEPTFQYLRHLGFLVTEEEGAFADFIRCKAHGDSHGAEHSHHGQPHTHVDAQGRVYTHTHDH